MGVILLYVYIYIYICVCVCVVYICVCVCFVYMFYFVSLSYLLVFGDDRVCGTREQRMLQVDLVRHRDGAGASWEIFIALFLLWILRIVPFDYEHGFVL